MAFSLSGGTSSGRSRFRGTGTLAEINIVPLVDVVMVLLIIFMLTAHVMEFGMEVDVPRVKESRNTAQELPVVTVTKDGTLYLNEQAVNIHEVGKLVKQRFPKSTAVYVRADKEAIWETLAQVIAELNQSKLGINMVTQPEDNAEKAAKARR